MHSGEIVPSKVNQPLFCNFQIPFRNFSVYWSSTLHILDAAAILMG